jgi:hypothetical protein
MPRLASLSSRSLTGVGIGRIALIKTFNLTLADNYSAWVTPQDIGLPGGLESVATEFTGGVAGPYVLGQDAGGQWARSSGGSPSPAVLRVTTPLTTPTEFTAIVKCRISVAAEPALTSDRFFYRSLGLTPSETIGYNRIGAPRELEYQASNGQGSSNIANGLFPGTPLLIVVLRQRDTLTPFRTVVIDLYNVETGQLLYRDDDPWRSNLAQSDGLNFPLGQAAIPIQFYEGATFNSYLSNTRLNTIYSDARAAIF